MKKGKWLHNEKIKNHTSNSKDVDLSIYGIFDTKKVLWEYYVISHTNAPTQITQEVCSNSYSMGADLNNIEGYGKKVKTKEEGIKFIEEYKIKWETGSNETLQEKRDQKLDNILG